LAALKKWRHLWRKRRSIQSAGQPVALAPLKNPLRMLYQHRALRKASRASTALR
jgi:hypothetical protein